MMKPYENTLNDLKAFKVRLSRLEERKRYLLQRFSEPSGVSFDKEGMNNHGDVKSPQERYIDAIYRTNKDGMTIDQEIEYCKSEISSLMDDVEKYKSIFSKIEGSDKIEKDLLEETMIRGKNITQAVINVADRNYVSESTVWRLWKRGKDVK